MYCTYFCISNFVGFGDRILLALIHLGLFPYASSLTFFFLILMACFLTWYLCSALCSALWLWKASLSDQLLVYPCQEHLVSFIV